MAYAQRWAVVSRAPSCQNEPRNRKVHIPQLRPYSGTDYRKCKFQYSESYQATGIGEFEWGVAVEVQKREFARLDGASRFHCLPTARNGMIVWDRQGLSLPDATKAGPYTNFK